MADRVRVIYHHEDGSWWAISPDLPDIIAAGDSREEVQRLVEEGLAEEDYELVHVGAEETPEYEPPASGRFLADLGRVAGPFLIVTGWRFENVELSEDHDGIIPVARDSDVVRSS
jgi:predicted RNase H-like HicB family nuclease